MCLVAIGQGKMVKKPVAGILHIIVYVGFVIINIEVLEIVIDGVFGTHRIFASSLGLGYDFLIASFEILAFSVLLACVLFLVRRFSNRIKRFKGVEMKAWPKKDALIILYAEVVLMTAFLLMNAADLKLQSIGFEGYISAGSFPVSDFLLPLLNDLSPNQIFITERVCWWFHILGILAFLNYLPYSKHFHIILAFPNTYYSNLEPKGSFTNMASVKNEVQMMMDPNADPYAAPPTDAPAPESFGAKDATDLNWVQLLNAYSCTECGRCTDNCPANQTGKLLSPRKIMMDTRYRINEIGNNKRRNIDDSKSLLGDYITKEEIWACTSCNACTDACPIELDPLSIIMDMRRYLVMEQSAAPTELNMMFTNIENNGAPWQFPAADRLNWKDE